MSKGLKALEIIKNAPTIYVGCASDIYTKYPFECKDIEKELKALEIIKFKQVEISFVIESDTYEEYIEALTDYALNYCKFLNNQDRLENWLDSWKLTEDEFVLLKEVLI